MNKLDLEGEGSLEKSKVVKSPFHHSRKPWERKDGLEKLLDVAIVSRWAFQHLTDKFLCYCQLYDISLKFSWKLLLQPAKMTFLALVQRKTAHLGACLIKSYLWSRWKHRWGQWPSLKIVTTCLSCSSYIWPYIEWSCIGGDIIFRISTIIDCNNIFIMIINNQQIWYTGCFFTGPPLKCLKYGKVNLG